MKTALVYEVMSCPHKRKAVSMTKQSDQKAGGSLELGRQVENKQEENIIQQVDDEESDEVEAGIVDHQSIGSSRKLRKRMSRESDDPENLLRECIGSDSKLIIFSGSGLSASSGMSMFSTEDGLYDRARKRFRVSDGKQLFKYQFYERAKPDVNKFYCDIYKETLKATPSHGHISIKMLYQQGRVQRHYTLNVDGLMDRLGDGFQWHPENNKDGHTVEVHGNLRQLFCPACGTVTPTNGSHIQAMRKKDEIICKRCYENKLRFKMVLYDDPDTDKITSEEIWDLLQSDLQKAHVVLWVGISFEQSASLEYFRKVGRMLLELDRVNLVKQLVINVDEEAVNNVQSATSSSSAQNLVFVKMTADDALTQLAQEWQYES